MTAISALLLFSGWVRTRAYFGYFGIDSDSLGFGPQDYLLRSGNLGVGAVLSVALVTGILLVADRVAIYFLCWIRSRRTRLRVEAGLAIIGIGTSLYSLYLVFDAVMIASSPSVGSGIAVALGALLFLRFGVRARNSSLGNSTAAFGLLILALAAFWSIDSYAEDIGHGAALQVDTGAIRLPAVTILSKEQLDIPGGEMSAGRVPQFDNQWAYRYHNAHLLVHGSDRWFLVTTSPAAGYRSTITVLKDSDNISVQVAAPDS